MIEKILTPELTVIIVTSVVMPFLISLSKYVTSLIMVKVDSLQAQIKNDTVNHLIDHAEDAVVTAVDAVTQTFVKTLKQKGEFTKDSALEAFNKAKEQAIIMMNEDTKKAVIEAKGDMDVWISNKIEAYLRNIGGVGFDTKPPVVIASQWDTFTSNPASTTTSSISVEVPLKEEDTSDVKQESKTTTKTRISKTRKVEGEDVETI